MQSKQEVRKGKAHKANSKTHPPTRVPSPLNPLPSLLHSPPRAFSAWDRNLLQVLQCAVALQRLRNRHCVFVVHDALAEAAHTAATSARRQAVWAGWHSVHNGNPTQCNIRQVQSEQEDSQGNTHTHMEQSPQSMHSSMAMSHPFMCMLHTSPPLNHHLFLVVLFSTLS